MNDRFKFRSFGRPNSIIEGMQNIYTFEETENGYANVKVEKGWLAFVEKEDLKIMQCTGLKDGNGKLIFEGDVLALQQFKDDNVVHICFWDEETAQYLYEPIIKGDKEAPLLGIEEFAQTTEYMFEDEDDTPVIIGNICENPKLLKDGE